jgi:hypothetical protein
MNVNRVILGLVSLFIVVGIVVLAARAIQSINLRRTIVPTSGKLALPSGQVASSPFVLATPRAISSSGTPAPSPFIYVSPILKASGFPLASPSGKLPATGLY